MRHAVRIVPLVGLWLLAWGDVSVANVASGVAVAVALSVAFPAHMGDDQARVRVAVFGSLRLAGYIAYQLVVSNVAMSIQILRRRSDARPGVIAHRLARPSEAVLTLMTSVISLSPGTMAVDVADDSSTVYVHLFDLRDVDAARASLDRLEGLVASALPPAGRAIAGARR